MATEFDGEAGRKADNLHKRGVHRSSPACGGKGGRGAVHGHGSPKEQGPYHHTWHCLPSWNMLLAVGIVLAAAAYEIHDVTVHSLPFVRHRPLLDHLLFVYAPLFVSVAAVAATAFCCARHCGDEVIVTPKGVVICRKRRDGSYTYYLEIPWEEMVVRPGGFYPVHFIDVGVTARQKRLYALFLPHFHELQEAIEERQTRARMQDDVAQIYLKTSGSDPSDPSRNHDGGTHPMKADARAARGARRADRRGYTLVEIMVVMLILSSIIGIVIPHLRRAVEKTDLSSCQQNLRNLAHAALIYANDDPLHYFPTRLQDLEPNYLSRLPTCPAVKGDTYTAVFQVSNTPLATNFTMYCGGGPNHAGLGLGVDQPYWTSAGGAGP